MIVLASLIRAVDDHRHGLLPAASGSTSMSVSLRAVDLAPDLGQPGGQEDVQARNRSSPAAG